MGICFQGINHFDALNLFSVPWESRFRLSECLTQIIRAIVHAISSTYVDGHKRLIHTGIMPAASRDATET
jgi:hypothetical protein